MTGFFNENLNRAYPFIRTTVARPDSGPLTTLNLPDAIIVDAGFVFGPKSRFEPGTHSVYLASVRRQGSTIFYDFASDAPGLFDVVLTFTRTITDPNYAAEFTDSAETGISASLFGSLSVTDCEEPLWSGFLVTGSMAEMNLLLPSDGTISRGTNASIVEPALLQNLAEAYVVKLNLANGDRTHVTAADDCPDQVFPGPIDIIHVAAYCITGDVAIKPGYNCTVTQNLAANAIVLGAAVGAGEGQPCAPVPLYPIEAPPGDSNLLEGGLRCNEVLRSFNGVGGRQFTISAGSGVSVNSVPTENKVTIDVDMTGLALCFDDLSRVSESC